MRRVVGVLAALAFATGCKPSTSDVASVDRYDPARDLGPLFQDVQLAGVFPDSKTFVDARPRSTPAAISKLFADKHSAAAFDLRAFVDQNFEIPRPVGRDFQTDTIADDGRAHSGAVASAHAPCGQCGHTSSLIPLPNPYVVPGGRFREVYYWDSYFTMLGLVESGRARPRARHARQFRAPRHDGRSHPERQPDLLPQPQPAAVLRRDGGTLRESHRHGASAALSDALETEHAFWMDGADRVKPGTRIAAS